MAEIDNVLSMQDRAIEKQTKWFNLVSKGAQEGLKISSEASKTIKKVMKEITKNKSITPDQQAQLNKAINENLTVLTRMERWFENSVIGPNRLISSIGDILRKGKIELSLNKMNDALNSLFRAIKNDIEISKKQSQIVTSMANQNIAQFIKEMNSLINETQKNSKNCETEINIAKKILIFELYEQRKKFISLLGDLEKTSGFGQQREWIKKTRESYIKTDKTINMIENTIKGVFGFFKIITLGGLALVMIGLAASVTLFMGLVGTIAEIISMITITFGKNPPEFLTRLTKRINIDELKKAMQINRA